MAIADENDAVEIAEIPLRPGNILLYDILEFLFEITCKIFLRKENVIKMKQTKKKRQKKKEEGGSLF